MIPRIGMRAPLKARSTQSLIIQIVIIPRSDDARLRICSVDDAVWSVMLITGLDKVFEFTDDVSTSLASLQLGL